MTENELLEKLRKVERLFAGATTPGERVAAADAMQRIKQRLKEQAGKEKEIEYKFTLADGCSSHCCVATACAPIA
jgi:hypothetical protein